METYTLKCTQCEAPLLEVTPKESNRITKVAALCPACTLEVTYSERKARISQLDKVDPAQKTLTDEVNDTYSKRKPRRS